MGKVLKYCSSCNEGFAERFAFCPVCGDHLQAYEMNPIAEDTPPEPEFLVSEEPAAVPFEASTGSDAVDATPVEVEAADTADEVVATPEPVEASEAAEEIEPLDLGEVDAAPEQTAAAEEGSFEEETASTDDYSSAWASGATTAAASGSVAAYTDELGHYTGGQKAEDGDYYITVINESGGRKRNALLLGATVLVLVTAVVSWGVSLFQKELGIASIGDEQSLAYLIEEVPMALEEEQEERKDDEDGGGGGGGGREDEQEVSQGDLADQSRNPTRPPDARTTRMDNPSLPIPPPQTEGDRKFPKEYDRWGDPNSRYAGISNGPGTGGGQGIGIGTGQGSGRGTGTGSGDGSGSGGGAGDGNGDGRGRGSGGAPPPPSGPSKALRIISNPKPGYTDEARKNAIQGTVVLRVTFLASGQIGSISTVKGLPNGLTEKAIAAARAIRFEPRMDSGIPKSVTRTIEYSFTMY